MATAVKIRWVTVSELSVAHAAYVVASGDECVDPRTQQILAEPVTNINARLVTGSIDVGTFWIEYRLQILRGISTNNACQKALLAAGCSELQIDQTGKPISRLLDECRSGFQRRYPKLDEQLDLRRRPLLQQWSTYGPGLLNRMREIFNIPGLDSFWPNRIDAICVQPVRGGDGNADDVASRIWIEAMLTDADPTVPEILRLAWLVCRLARPQSEDGEFISSTCWEMASVPVVLAAAQHLDIVSDLAIESAMRLWRSKEIIPPPVLIKWWEDASSDNATMVDSILTLDRTISASLPPQN